MTYAALVAKAIARGELRLLDPGERVLTRREIRILAHKESEIHQAADKASASIQVAVGAAFASGRRQMHRPYTTAQADRAVQAITRALKSLLPKALQKAVKAGGDVGAALLARRKRARAASMRTAAGSVAFRFDVTNPAVVSWARAHAAELITQISDTSRDRIRAAIEDLTESGDWTAATARIADAVGSVERAAFIARNESMQSASAGQRMAWDQARGHGLLSGRERVAWIATFGACPLCADLDGKERSLTGEYPSPGGEGPQLHPGCRCSEGVVG